MSTELKPQVSEFLQEAEGGFSATRLVFIIWSLGALLMWMVMSFYKGTLQPVDPAVATILGILMGGKTLQRFAENAPQPAATTGLPPIAGAPNPPAGDGLPAIPAKKKSGA